MVGEGVGGGEFFDSFEDGVGGGDVFVSEVEV